MARLGLFGSLCIIHVTVVFPDLLLMTKLINYLIYCTVSDIQKKMRLKASQNR